MSNALTVSVGGERHWCLFCPDLILEHEQAATGAGLLDPLGDVGHAHVDCADANGYEVQGAGGRDPLDMRRAFREGVRDRGGPFDEEDE